MRDLMQTMVGRPAEQLSPERIEKLGFKIHQEEMQSEIYQEISKDCRDQKISEVQAKASRFLAGKEAVNRIEDLPQAFQAPLELMAYKNYNFEHSDIAEFINTRAKKSIFGEDYSDGKICSTSPFYEARTRLEDSILLRAVVDAPRPEVDLQNVLKGLIYLEKTYRFGRLSKNINIKRHFDKPIILSSCILHLDPCEKKDLAGPNVPSRPITAGGCNCDDGSAGEDCNDNDCCECECNTQCIEQDQCCVKLVPHIGELFIIRDWVSCYRPEEIAKIETVLESEIREKNHRRLKREEYYSETETELSVFEETTHQTDKNTTMSEEVDKAVDRELSLNIGASFTYGGEKTPYSATASTSLSSNTAKHDARRIAKTTATQIMDRAVKSVNQKVKTLSSSRLTSEVEEINRHVFGGETGAKHDISRTFHDVVEERTAQMFSAGLRAMVKIDISEPSALFWELLNIKFDLPEPVEPTFPIFICDDITVKNYQQIATSYGVAANAPPKKGPDIYLTYRGKKGDQITVNVPPGYTATKMTRKDSYLYRPNGLRKGHVAFSLDGDNVAEWKGKNTSNRYSATISVRGQANATITGTNYNNNSWIEVSLLCTPDEPDIGSWKEELCALIQDTIKTAEDDYVKDVENYAEAKIEHDARQEALLDQRLNQSNFALSEIIKENLAHHAKTVIACDFFDKDNGMRNRVKPCGLPQMNLRQTEQYAAIVDLLDRSFDWKYMTYMLYGKSHAQKCKWRDIAQRQQSRNELFQKFLDSGWGTVIVPITLGAEDRVSYFLSTGKIWDGGGSPPVADDVFAQIFQEVKTQKDRYATEREGFIIHDTSYAPALAANQIILRNNDDYYDDTTLPATFDPQLANEDIDREIFINKLGHRILSIDENSNGDVIITLNQDLPAADQDRQWTWATGYLFVGGEWLYRIGTPHVWLRENMRCLPCTYPIECEEVE